MPWRVVGVCAHAPEGLVDRSCSWRRTMGDFRHRLSFRGPYLTSHHDDRTPPHTTLDDVIIWLDEEGARGVVGDDGNESATTGTTAVMAATIPATSHLHTRPRPRLPTRARTDGWAGGRAGGRTDGRTGGRAGDDARTGGRTSGASMGRTCGRLCACVDVSGRRVFRFVPPRDVSAPPRRTHRAMHRQVGYRAVGRLKSSGPPAIKSSRSIRTTEMLNIRAISSISS